MPRALVTLLIASCCAEESIWLRRKHWVWADATNQLLVPGCSHEDAMTRQWAAELTTIMCPALPLDAACADRAAATLSAARSAAASAARGPRGRRGRREPQLAEDAHDELLDPGVVVQDAERQEPQLSLIHI